MNSKKGLVPGTPLHSFTVKADSKLRVLKTDVFISAAHTPPSQIITGLSSEYKKFVGIWDTGATNSTITENVVNQCGLAPTGMTKVQTASGEDTANTYSVNIGLPNKVLLPYIRVNDAKLGDQADVLIGMDIISQGDFAITNKDGTTIFSFRVPSIADIDFVEEEKSAAGQVVRPSRKIGRNEPCPCGSGKKYKKCHGANV